MKKIRLANALKIKNRLAGEVKRLQEIFCRENSRSEFNKSTIDVTEVSRELDSTVETLIRVKSAIARANIDIYEKIERMSEYKAQINFHNNIPTLDELVVASPRRGGSAEMRTQYTAFLKKSDIDRITKELQTKIEALQDQIDEYNASNFIEVEI